MTIEYFPPLPKSDFDPDRMRQWLGQQTVSFQKIITGTLQVGQILSSSNFVSGTSGWQIDGDGNAEFNDVTVRGDIESGNWNGASPANLASTFDSAATAGFYLDSSAGAAQFMGPAWIKVGVGILGNPGAGSLARIGVVTGTDTDKTMLIQAEGGLMLEALGNLAGSNNFVAVNSHMNITGTNQFRAAVGSASLPGIAFVGDNNTGFRHVGADNLALVTGGADRVDIASSLMTMSVPILGSTDAAAIYMASSSTSLATTTPRVVLGQDFVIAVRTSAPTLFPARNSDGPQIQLTRSGSVVGGIGVTSGTPTLYAGSGFTRVLSVLDGGSSSSLFLLDGLTDVGNHETLRLDRGTGTLMRAVGYFSSWAEGKEDILPLRESPRFPGLDIIDNLNPIDFKRKSTGQREWGFLLDDFKELDDNLRYLTTKGDEWGYSPDEFAISALQTLAIQDLRQRVAVLETA